MRAVLFVVILTLVVGCGKSSPPAAQSTPSAAITKLDTQHLPNAVRLHPRVISGGLPEGDKAFAELAALGIKTVISVDGAKPDVAVAERHGLRYVHLPHGYDGITSQRGQELAKAVLDLPGPIYIHCHHGKHRSPAAATVACVGAGLLPATSAKQVLEVAGTSPHYLGLWQAAERATPLDTALLEALEVKYPAVAEIPPLAEAMVALEHTFDHLKTIAASEWRVPAKHPDLDPAHEALLLREHFTELLRSEYLKDQPEEFSSSLTASEAAAQALEQGLRDWTPVTTPEPPATIGEAFKEVSARCQSCHEQFRDQPLLE